MLTTSFAILLKKKIKKISKFRAKVGMYSALQDAVLPKKFDYSDKY